MGGVLPLAQRIRQSASGMLGNWEDNLEITNGKTFQCQIHFCVHLMENMCSQVQMIKRSASRVLLGPDKVVYTYFLRATPLCHLNCIFTQWREMGCPHFNKIKQFCIWDNSKLGYAALGPHSNNTNDVKMHSFSECVSTLPLKLW